jgi:hypothetical protein
MFSITQTLKQSSHTRKDRSLIVKGPPSLRIGVQRNRLRPKTTAGQRNDIQILNLLSPSMPGNSLGHIEPKGFLLIGALKQS